MDTLHLVCFLTCDAIDVEKATSEAVLVDVRICCLCRFYAVYMLLSVATWSTWPDEETAAATDPLTGRLKGWHQGGTCIMVR